MSRLPAVVVAAILVSGCGGSKVPLRPPVPPTSDAPPPSSSPPPSSAATTLPTTTAPSPTPTATVPATTVPATTTTGQTVTTLSTPPTLPYNQTEVPPCQATDLMARAMADRSSYPSETPVNVTVVVANRSAHPCAFSSSGSVVTISDASGATVYPTSGFGYPGCPNGVLALPPSYLLRPGQAFAAGGATWDQRHHSCRGPDPGPRYPTGGYTAAPRVSGHDGPVTAITTVSFRLV